jgi:hypothetical protein
MTSNDVSERMMLIDLLRPPGLAAKSDPSTNIEMCPKLKKKIMKIVAIKMALGHSLISRKLIAQKIEPSRMENNKGRMIIFASTSRKFQVSNARLG